MGGSLTHAIEDYLKTIYELTADQELATTSQIAESLAVTAASVTAMLKKMASMEPPLVEYRKHRGVALLPAGEKAALEVIRHHRLLELYLHENLGYGWDEVHPEADRLEHVISEDLEERIARALGDPEQDPHGDPIPSRDLRLPERPAVPLNQLGPGQHGVVRRVRDRNAELLRYLSGIGLIPDARFEVLDYTPLDGNLHLRIEGQAKPVVIGPRITRQVFVEISKHHFEEREFPG